MKGFKTSLLSLVILSALTLIVTSCDVFEEDGNGVTYYSPPPTPLTQIYLPQTGQTASYATGDDGELRRGVSWPSQRFTANMICADTAIIDNLTGLMWVKSPDSTKRTWADAITYANDLVLCGFTDWRLPNIKELRSLINYGLADPDTWLNGQGFTNVQSDDYWSSTTFASNTDLAWFVRMSGGGVNVNAKTNSNYVWPVQGY
ncbi:MAG: DUF1566 domain-containing protein [Nitrospira sp.]|nr:DUF1566 domain-containing protein [Nitrospira sp.]